MIEETNDGGPHQNPIADEYITSSDKNIYNRSNGLLGIKKTPVRGRQNRISYSSRYAKYYRTPILETEECEEVGSSCEKTQQNKHQLKNKYIRD